ncbi:MAG: hypothetical protein PHG18_02505 [Bacilli bacterium]|nr:hypothetical protein [Bacilli bacterium]
MKKKILISLLSLLTIVLCSTLAGYDDKDKYTDYEHYNLNGKDILTYTYVLEYGVNNTYAIADITPEKSEIDIRGLFYKISSDDYILLDKIESSDHHKSTSDKYNVFYGNKLFAIGNGSSPLIAEYTLNYEKIVKKELKFEMPETPNGLLIRNIDHIKDDYIYLSAFAGYGSDYEITKCSLDTYKCELSKE